MIRSQDLKILGTEQLYMVFKGLKLVKLLYCV